MNRFPKSSIDPMAMAQQIAAENNKTIRELFKHKINGSFLVKIKSIVCERIPLELFNLYPISFDNREVITGNGETLEYDICRIIVGVHRHHSIFLSQEEIYAKQKDPQYQEQLVREVIEKIRLRSYGSKFFRKQPLLPGDEFLYFPVPYELFVLCVRSVSLAEGCEGLLYNIINNALAALALMENNMLSHAYPLCRGMIEQYLKALILIKHPEGFEQFTDFCGFEIEQSCCSQEYPDAFIKLFNRRNLPIATNKNAFLHYGWLDKIADYRTQAPNRYSIYGILDYLMEHADNDQYDELCHIKRLYQMCHGYTHGSTVNVKYPLLQYFEISMMLYYVVPKVFEKIHTETNTILLPEDQLLINILDRDFSTLYEQYKIRSTDNFELYYRINPPIINQ